MIIKILLFVGLYILWIMGALFIVFGVLLAGQPPGVIPFPYILLYLVVILIPIWPASQWLTGQPRWAKDVLAGGTQAAAAILSVNDAGFSVNRTRFYKIKLRVEPHGEDPFEITLEKPLFWGNALRPGEKVQVKYDPNNHKHVIILSDTDTSQPASTTTSAGFDVANQAKPASRTADANLSEELSNLARLHKNGDLSDDEFERAKKKLLD